MIALIAALNGCAVAERTIAPDPADPVASLAWLTGSWRGGEADVTYEEHWTDAAGGTMLGVNRTIRGGRTVAFEFLRIVVAGRDLVYLASPGGRDPATPFRMTESAPDRVVFANPDHDFPHRIIYERRGDVLHARIEGEVDGAANSSEWTYRRDRRGR